MQEKSASHLYRRMCQSVGRSVSQLIRNAFVTVAGHYMMHDEDAYSVLYTALFRFFFFHVSQTPDLDRFDGRVLENDQNYVFLREEYRKPPRFSSRTIDHRSFGISTVRGERAVLVSRVSRCDLFPKQRGTCLDFVGLGLALTPCRICQRYDDLISYFL